MLNPSLKDLGPSSEELKEVAKLLAQKKVLKAIKACMNNSNRIEKIRKEFNESRHKFSKSKTIEIGRNLYEIKNKKKSFCIKNGRDRKFF